MRALSAASSHVQISWRWLKMFNSVATFQPTLAVLPARRVAGGGYGAALTGDRGGRAMSQQPGWPQQQPPAGYAQPPRGYPQPPAAYQPPPGYAPAGHAPPRPPRRRDATGGWAMVPVLTAGLAAFVPALHAAIKLRRRNLWIAAGALAAAAVFVMLMVAIDDAVPSPPAPGEPSTISVFGGFGTVVAIAAAAAGTVLAFRLRG